MWTLSSRRSSSLRSWLALVRRRMIVVRAISSSLAQIISLGVGGEAGRGVGLLPDPQPVQFGLEGGPVHDYGQAQCTGAPAGSLPVAGWSFLTVSLSLRALLPRAV